MRTFPLVLGVSILAACASPASRDVVPASYLDSSGRADFLSGGVRMIPIETPEGTFRVWTKRTGNNPTIKVLLLHGGPGFNSELLQIFDSYFPGAGIEYYYYDQLGSYFSDQPDDPSLWDVARFVEEVEQVRVALGLDSDDFYLWGHSWGGALAMEYALKYQEHLRGLVISDMMASIPAYNEYADHVFKTEMDPAVLAELKVFEAAEDYENPRYMELLFEHHYVEHVLRMPVDEWPDCIHIAFEHMNPNVSRCRVRANWERAASSRRGTAPPTCTRSASRRS